MAVQQAQNVFTGGLNKDLNPISQGNDTLTDALNATTITFNGNELLLQNDMGNTNLTYYPKVYNSDDETNTDSPNCEMVKLKDGYIPIGMKEFGDIVYIVSHNPMENRTEIGSFPGPDFQLDNIQPIECNSVNDASIEKQNSDNLGKQFQLNLKDKNNNLLKLQVGDKVEFELYKKDSDGKIIESPINLQYLSTPTENKLFKLIFTNLLTGEDITKQLPYDLDIINNKLSFFYPNIQTGSLGISFELEQKPDLYFQGLKSYDYNNVNKKYTLKFNNITIQEYSYVKISQLKVYCKFYDIDVYGEPKFPNQGAILTANNIKADTSNKDIPQTIEFFIDKKIDEITGKPINEFDLENINFEITFSNNKVYNNARLEVTFIPYIDYLDNQGTTCICPDGNIINYIPCNIDPITIIWDLNKGEDQLDYSSTNIIDIETEYFDYNNVSLSRNLMQDISDFLQTKYIVSDPYFVGTAEKGAIYMSRSFHGKDGGKMGKDPVSQSIFNLKSETLEEISNKEFGYFKNVSENWGSAIILYDAKATDNSDNTYWKNSIELQGDIIPSNHIMTTNLFDCTKIIEDLSTIEYYPSSNSLGIVVFPGGSFSDPSLFGEISDWSGKRQAAAKVECQLIDIENPNNPGYLFANTNLFLLNTNDYDRDAAGQKQRDKRIVSDNLYTQDEYVSKKIELLQTGTDYIKFKNSKKYKLKAEGWTVKWNQASGDGTGSNAHLVFPSIGGFQTESINSINTPKLHPEFIVNDSFTLPKSEYIDIIYNFPAKAKGENVHKTAFNEKTILINENPIISNDCQFMLDGILLESELTNNTILYNQYTWESISPKTILYNKPSCKYFVFACWSTTSDALLKNYLKKETFYFDKKFESKIIYLHLYLLDNTSKEDFEFTVTSKDEKWKYFKMINPQVWEASFFKYDGDNNWFKVSGYNIEPNQINMLYYKDGNGEHKENNYVIDNIYWTDPQLPKVDININLNQKSDYYFAFSDQQVPITNHYYPKPLYYINSLTYKDNSEQ